MRIRHVKGAEEAVAQSPFVIQEPELWKGRWHEIFGNANPIELEVGMGMGTFLRKLAALYPEKNYIGFEINTTVLYKALNRYLAGRTEQGLTAEPEACNLRFIRSDARFLDADFGDGEVDKIYLNFSDPWPKDKNANKRLTSPGFLQRYAKILKPNGVIEFKTDNRGLFDYSAETFPEAGWEILELTHDLHQDARLCAGNVMTEYEAKFSAKGNPICKLIARYRQD